MPTAAPLIPYFDLPRNAFEAVHDSLVGLGFADEAILTEYSFSTQSGQAVKINALASAHPKHHTPTAEYAGFTVYSAQNGLDDYGIVQTLAYSAAPFHLIHRDGKFAFWASNVQTSQPQPLNIQHDVAYDQLKNVLREYEVDLKPQRIVEVKQGRSKFRHPLFAEKIQPLQLSLWAANVTRPLLVKYFGKAVNSLREQLKREETTVNIATQLLGAIILADTGGLGETLRLEDGYGLDSLIEVAHAKFPTYFDQQLFERNADIARYAHTILRQIRYVGFSPEMLSEIYAAAYGLEHRKKLGRYDTPLYLTRRIWENIPVEFLPPEQRVTVDMTCGWGSFLLAGYQRLSGLTDMQDASLRKYIHGNDNDPHFLTSRLAGLGLLLSTSEDSWHVDHQDALKWDWLNLNKPNIIVGNPPFGGARKGKHQRTSPNKKERYEEANKFLLHSIEKLALNGFLAMLMPQSFVASESAPNLRKILFKSCDVFELWELPIGVFQGATAGVLVIFAQKKNGSQQIYQAPTVTRSVQKQSLEYFKHHDLFTNSGIAIDQSKWNEYSRKSKHSKNTHIIDFKLTMPEYKWQEIQDNSTEIQRLSIVFPGAIVGDPERGIWSDYEFPQEVDWLSNAKSVIKRPFFLDYSQSQYIVYPNDLEWPRKDRRRPEYDKEKYLSNDKVLLSATNNPSWGRRIKVGIERKSHYVSDSFWIIVPNQEGVPNNMTLEVLAAVVNWKVSNAWIVEHLKYPKIPARAIRTIPFPKNLSKDDCQTITEAVHRIEAAVMDNKPEPEDAVKTIDDILKAAYQLDDETYNRLTMIYEWDTNPQITLDVQPNPEAQWEISGIVESVNAADGTITLWLNGFDHFETVLISAVMPGWLLRPNAAFRTTIPREYARKQTLANVAWGKFYPQEYTYLNEEELFEQLTQTFYPNIEPQ